MHFNCIASTNFHRCIICTTCRKWTSVSFRAILSNKVALWSLFPFCASLLTSLFCKMQQIHFLYKNWSKLLQKFCYSIASKTDRLRDIDLEIGNTTQSENDGTALLSMGWGLPLACGQKLFSISLSHTYTQKQSFPRQRLWQPEVSEDKRSRRHTNICRGQHWFPVWHY